MQTGIEHEVVLGSGPYNVGHVHSKAFREGQVKIVDRSLI